MTDAWWLGLFGLLGIALNNLTTIAGIIASKRNAASLAQLHDCVDGNHAETIALVTEKHDQLAAQITQDVIPAVATVAEVAARIEDKQQ